MFSRESLLYDAPEITGLVFDGLLNQPSFSSSFPYFLFTIKGKVQNIPSHCERKHKIQSGTRHDTAKLSQLQRTCCWLAGRWSRQDAAACLPTRVVLSASWSPPNPPVLPPRAAPRGTGHPCVFSSLLAKEGV